MCYIHGNRLVIVEGLHFLNTSLDNLVKTLMKNVSLSREPKI